MNRIFNNKGISLLEIIIASLVAAVAMLMTLPLLISSNISFMGASAFAQDKIVGDSIYGFVVDQLTYAGRIELLPGDSTKDPAYENVLAVDQDGRLTFNGEGLYGEHYYDGKTVKLLVTADGRNHLEIAVELYSKAEDDAAEDSEGILVYQTKSSVNAINIMLDSYQRIEGATGIELENPIISYELRPRKVNTAGNGTGGEAAAAP